MHSETKRERDCKAALIVFLEEKNRERVQSQFSDSLALGDAEALYRAFVEDTVSACLEIDCYDLIISTPQGEPKLVVTQAIEDLRTFLKGKARKRIEAWGIEIWEQQENDTAGNMNSTFERSFSLGYDQVVLIDCVTPTIPQRILKAASRALNSHDIVFGPTLEGSFYLLGMRKLIPEIFSKIDWSNDDGIYPRLVDLARADNLNWGELDLWYDLRQPEDIEFLVRDINDFRRVGDERSAKRTETVLTSLIDKLQSKES